MLKRDALEPHPSIYSKDPLKRSQSRVHKVINEIIPVEKRDEYVFDIIFRKGVNNI